MTLHPYPVVLALALGLAACHPPISEYTESEAPNRLILDGSTNQLDLRFPAGSAALSAGEVARLRRLAATGAIAPADRVLVSAGGSSGLAAARIGAISAELLRYGVVARPLQRADVPPNGAAVEVVRYLVTLPPCPNWSKEPANDFTNTPASNLGCPNATNLGRMVASPSDLASGRPLGPADGMPAAAAVNRYMNDKIQPLGGGAGAGGAGAGGGGGTGTGGGGTGGGGGAGGSP